MAHGRNNAVIVALVTAFLLSTFACVLDADESDWPMFIGTGNRTPPRQGTALVDDLDSISVAVEAFALQVGRSQTRLTLNCKAVSAETDGKLLTYGGGLPDIGTGKREADSPRPMPIAVRWSTDVVRLPTGGRATATVHLRNLDVSRNSADGRIVPQTISGTLRLVATEGIQVKPSAMRCWPTLRKRVPRWWPCSAAGRASSTARQPSIRPCRFHA